MMKALCDYHIVLFIYPENYENGIKYYEKVLTFRFRNDIIQLQDKEIQHLVRQKKGAGSPTTNQIPTPNKTHFRKSVCLIILTHFNHFFKWKSQSICLL